MCEIVKKTEKTHNRIHRHSHLTNRIFDLIELNIISLALRIGAMNCK